MTDDRPLIETNPYLRDPVFRQKMTEDAVATHRAFDTGPHRVVNPMRHCDLCGHPYLDVHCKLRCESCGFVRDCSDMDF